MRRSSTPLVCARSYRRETSGQCACGGGNGCRACAGSLFRPLGMRSPGLFADHAAGRMAGPFRHLEHDDAPAVTGRLLHQVSDLKGPRCRRLPDKRCFRPRGRSSCCFTTCPIHPIAPFHRLVHSSLRRRIFTFNEEEPSLTGSRKHEASEGEEAGRATWSTMNSVSPRAFMSEPTARATLHGRPAILAPSPAAASLPTTPPRQR